MFTPSSPANAQQLQEAVWTFPTLIMSCRWALIVWARQILKRTVKKWMQTSARSPQKQRQGDSSNSTSTHGGWVYVIITH